MNDILKKMAQVAHELDRTGHHQEADEVTSVIEALSLPENERMAFYHAPAPPAAVAPATTPTAIPAASAAPAAPAAQTATPTAPTAVYTPQQITELAGRYGQYAAYMKQQTGGSVEQALEMARRHMTTYNPKLNWQQVLPQVNQAMQNYMKYDIPKNDHFKTLGNQEQAYVQKNTNMYPPKFS